jgi:hypothetical protein
MALPETATSAQKSQNSGFAHVCLGFITQKQRENTSRRQRVYSNNCYVKKYKSVSTVLPFTV